jgi:hypothetical protein
MGSAKHPDSSTSVESNGTFGCRFYWGDLADSGMGIPTATTFSSKKFPLSFMHAF